jgi:uncharacterized membrane protein YdfJ with MMPL/SSD domain
MNLSVNWKGLGLGLGMAALAASKATAVGAAAGHSQLGWLFLAGLVLFLWPALRDLIAVLLWKPQRRPTGGRPARSRMIESSSAQSGSSLLQRPSGERDWKAC